MRIIKAFSSKLLSIEGRATHKEYFLSALFIILISYSILRLNIFIFGPNSGFIPIMFLAITMLLLLIRRYHDFGISGWWLFCIFPYAYWCSDVKINLLKSGNPLDLFYFLILSPIIILALVPGDKKDNKYGKNPY